MQILVPILLVASLLSGISHSTYGQADFRTGCIVPLTGDTVRGFVDYRSARGNSVQGAFRPSASAPVQAFGPEQLRG